MKSLVCELTLETDTPSNPLLFTVALNEEILFENKIDQPSMNIEFLLEDLPVSAEPVQKELIFTLSGKNNSHWDIDKHSGYIKINSFSIGDIKIFDNLTILDEIFDQGKYIHYGNGFSDTEINEPFTEFLGCNGNLILPIKFPIYMWLLSARTSRKH